MSRCASRSRLRSGLRASWRFAIAVSFLGMLGGCTVSSASDSAVASPRVVACDEAALGIQARVNEAREILEQRAPVMADDLQNVVELVKNKDLVRADASYRRLKDGLQKIEESSNELLQRFDGTVVQCDESASRECWSGVTDAYQAAGGDAIATLHEDLGGALGSVELFFSLDRKATKKQTRSSYLELREALQQLRAGAMDFARAHNEAVEEFNACTSA